MRYSILAKATRLVSRNGWNRPKVEDVGFATGFVIGGGWTVFALTDIYDSGIGHYASVIFYGVVVGSIAGAMWPLTIGGAAVACAHRLEESLEN